MKKIFVFCILIIGIIISPCYSQNRVIIRYVDASIETPIRIPGYLFSKWKVEELSFKDSTLCTFFKRKIDSLLFCDLGNTICRFPDVRQQIIVVYGEEYDIVSSDGSTAMEKNGKSVVFDIVLQSIVNKIIDNDKTTKFPNRKQNTH